MGGCCCCASRSADPERTPIYIYCPREIEENEPLSTPHVTSTAVPVGLLADTNLATSSPDTYRAPPVPLPYDVLACQETVPQNIEDCGNKTDMQSIYQMAVGEIVSAAGFENSDTCEGLKGTECKGKSDSPKVKEEKSKFNKPFSSAMDEEDVCPTCLEVDGYFKLQVTDHDFIQALQVSTLQPIGALPGQVLPVFWQTMLLPSYPPAPGPRQP